MKVELLKTGTTQTQKTINNVKKEKEITEIYDNDTVELNSNKSGINMPSITQSKNVFFKFFQSEKSKEEEAFRNDVLNGTYKDYSFYEPEKVLLKDGTVRGVSRNSFLIGLDEKTHNYRLAGAFSGMTLGLAGSAIFFPGFLLAFPISIIAGLAIGGVAGDFIGTEKVVEDFNKDNNVTIDDIHPEDRRAIFRMFRIETSGAIDKDRYVITEEDFIKGKDFKETTKELIDIFKKVGTNRMSYTFDINNRIKDIENDKDRKNVKDAIFSFMDIQKPKIDGYRRGTHIIEIAIYVFDYIKENPIKGKSSVESINEFYGLLQSMKEQKDALHLTLKIYRNIKGIENDNERESAKNKILAESNLKAF